MRKAVFGQAVTAIDVEHLRADTGPTNFVRLCGALIGNALARHVGPYKLLQVSEPMTVPDGGVDAEYTIPEALSVPETGGLVGPGKTVFQLKYRDATRASKLEIVRKIVQRLRDDAHRVAPLCDRYALLTNVHLSDAQPRQLRNAVVESCPAFEHKPIVIWGAVEIALSLSLTPHLRRLFFPEGGPAPLAEWCQRSEDQEREGWIWDYRICRGDLERMIEKRDSPERRWAIARLLKDAPRERVLDLLTPSEILEALRDADEATRQKWEGWAHHWSQHH
jgi:hypothetical protein